MFEAIVNNAQGKALEALRKAINNRDFDWRLTMGKEKPVEEQIKEMQQKELAGLSKTHQQTVEQRTVAVTGILNLDTGEFLPFQFAPMELVNKDESRWVDIESMGRNLCFYQFTTGTKQLEMDIIWVQIYENNDPIASAKKLVSWSKNDGQNAAPARVKFIWGESLYADAEYIILAASYTQSLFAKNRDMNPLKVRQNIRLGQISTTNPTRADLNNKRL